MAKKTQRRSTTGLQESFGPVAARVNALKAQRADVIRELHDVIATAQQMLNDLGEAPATGAGNGRRGRPTGRGAGKRRRLSPEGRAAIVAAAKKRWAKYHREQRQAS